MVTMQCMLCGRGDCRHMDDPAMVVVQTDAPKVVASRDPTVRVNYTDSEVFAADIANWERRYGTKYRR